MLKQKRIAVFNENIPACFSHYFDFNTWEELIKHAVDERPMDLLLDACQKLYWWQFSNSECFSDLLFSMFQKADPSNYEKLIRGFPDHHYAYQLWYHAPSQEEFFNHFVHNIFWTINPNTSFKNQDEIIKGERMKVEYFDATRTPHGCVVVTNNGPLDPHYELHNHSPNGFEWGYAGSGPAQLALAMCAELVGTARALVVYQQFKDAFLADLKDDNWRISAESCLEIILAIEMVTNAK